MVEAFDRENHRYTVEDFDQVVKSKKDKGPNRSGNRPQDGQPRGSERVDPGQPGKRIR